MQIPMRSRDSGGGQEKALISVRTFLLGAGILVFLLAASGILGRVLPSGQFEYRVEADGSRYVIPGTYREVPRPDYPAWRWFTAPVESLWGPDAALVLQLSVLFFMIAGAMKLLNHAGVLTEIVTRVGIRFGDRRFRLVAAMVLFCMAIGALVGIFEESLLILPVALALARRFRWDPVTGIAISFMATGFGFSAAITNPWSIGVAQRVVGLPAYSGSWLRILFFLAVYAVTVTYLLLAIRRKERRTPHPTPYMEGEEYDWSTRMSSDPRMTRAVRWFAASMLIMVAIPLALTFIPPVAGLSLPIMTLLYVVAGFGTALRSGLAGGRSVRLFLRGGAEALPGVVLVLIAVGVKTVMMNSEVLDTILYRAAEAMEGRSGVASLYLAFGLIVLLEFFMSSASGKAVLVMPLTVPLVQLVGGGLTLQSLVLAFQIGDGFTNVLFPTSPVLLIALGMASVGYPRWLRFILPLQGLILLLSFGFMALAVLVGYGP